jgi:hypothetical protein
MVGIISNSSGKSEANEWFSFIIAVWSDLKMGLLYYSCENFQMMHIITFANWLNTPLRYSSYTLIRIHSIAWFGWSKTNQEKPSAIEKFPVS